MSAPSATPAFFPLDPTASKAALSQRKKHVHSADIPLKVCLAGLSNSAAALFTNPMDLVKVRQQLQIKTTGGAPPANWARTLVTMVQQEGTLSIWKGLSASLLREGSYSGIRMGTYDLLKGSISSYLPEGSTARDGLAVKLSAGMASGMLGASIANPADLLKVRMQAHGATGTLRAHTGQIYNAAGVAGLYKAVWPTTLRAGILTSSQLGTYDQVKGLLKTDFPNAFEEGLPTHLVASGIAGFVCSAASNPVDVIKVRIMNDKASLYRNAIHCAGSILKNEGPLAFYKGFTMCFLRLWPHSVLSLLVFEQLRKFGGLAPI